MPELDLVEELLRLIHPDRFKAFIQHQWQNHQTSISDRSERSPETRDNTGAIEKLTNQKFNRHAITINDQQFLTEFIPEDLRRDLMRSPAGMQIMSFVVRHRLSNLYLEYLQSPDPIHLGFNAIGAFLIQANKKACAHVDSHTGLQCTALTVNSSHFCESHLHESWWKWPASEQAPGDASTQARMLSFYHDLNNASYYEDAELEEMLRWFWRKYQQEFARNQAESSGLELSEIVSLLGFPDLSALEKASRKEVRQAYHKASLHLHPDHGGNAEDFIKLQQAYQAWLDWRS